MEDGGIRKVICLAHGVIFEQLAAFVQVLGKIKVPGEERRFWAETTASLVELGSCLNLNNPGVLPRASV